MGGGGALQRSSTREAGWGDQLLLYVSSQS
jgi:hypothetical protein